MCGTGTLEAGDGHREYFSTGPGPEKKGKKYLCFYGRFRTFVEYHIFSEKSNVIPYFGQGLEKKGEKYLCVFVSFRPFGVYFIFAEQMIF